MTDHAKIVRMDVALHSLVKVELEQCRARWGECFELLALNGTGARRSTTAKCCGWRAGSTTPGRSMATRLLSMTHEAMLMNFEPRG